MITPPYLSEGSKIAIVAPARKVTYDEISYAVEYIRGRGYIPVYDERLFLSYNQFAGTDDERAAVLQYYLDIQIIFFEKYLPSQFFHQNKIL